MNKVIDNILIGNLSNDLTTYLREIDIAGDFVSLSISINKGSINEADEESGVAHFLEHMIIDCSAMKDISFKRVYRQAYTDFFETSYLFNCYKKDLNFCLSIIAKLIKGEFLQERDIERVREHVLKEYTEVTNSVDYKIMQILCENNIQYCSHYPIGTKKSIEDMTYYKVISFFDKYYSAQNMALVIVGNIQEATTLELIRKKFSNVRQAERRKEIRANYKYSYGKYSILNNKRKGIEIYFCIKNVILLSDYKIVKNELMDTLALDVIEKSLACFFFNATIECKIRKFSKSNSFLTILLQGNVSEIEIEQFFKKGLFVNIYPIISDVISEYQAFLLCDEGFGINLDSARSECIGNFIYQDSLICYDLGYSKEREVLYKITCNDIYERIIEWVVGNDYKIIFLN
mgnify:CR=1 FL=1